MAETLEVVRNAENRRFEAHLGGETAFTAYELAGDSIVLPHTVVPPAFEGRGVGGKLARAALDYARAEGLKVKPLCTFIAGYIVKHPEYQDLVHPDFKAGLGIA